VSGKTVFYLLIINNILISCIIIELLIKRRTIPAETRNGTPHLNVFSVSEFCSTSDAGRTESRNLDRQTNGGRTLPAHPPQTGTRMHRKNIRMLVTTS
jgi:hypothetical protein